MKYPIGIQSFEKLRRGNYVYVDKTRQLFDLVENGASFFLSRPRRFGKSLLLSTLDALYRCERTLFTGLWIEDKWDWKTRRHPVVWLKFSELSYRKLGIEKALLLELDRIAATHQLQLNGVTLKERFRQLLQQLAVERNVVLLIDEYDKPIINFIENPDQAEANRDALKDFYSVIKDSDPYLELVFITGVSAFSKVSIFSDQNNLENITLSPQANDLVGITQAELEHTFADQLKELDSEQVRRWYNGYRWNGDVTLYNPFSILNFFKTRQFRNYWFETGTPTFLVKALRRAGYYHTQTTFAPQHDLTNFDIRKLRPVTLLFQTGYLTIVEYVEEDRLYTLNYPNLEVEYALQQVLLNEYLDNPEESAGVRVVRLRNALQTNDLATVVDTINTALADIPAPLWRNQTEHFYHAVVHLIFSLLGTYIRSEVYSARGRCDALVETEKYIYAFEFKLDKSAAVALKQIDQKGYLTPYQNNGKQCFAVGVNFASASRKIVDWEVVEKSATK